MPITKYPLDTADAAASDCASFATSAPRLELAVKAACSAAADFDFKSKAAKNAPTLPPAPTIPEIEPIAFY